MAEQQFKPARPFIEQFLLDKDKVGIFKALGMRTNDPVKKKVLNALDFITPDPNNPLDYVGGGSGKVAAGFFSNLPTPLAKKVKATMKKIEDLELKVKRERAALKSDGRPASTALEKAENSLKAQNKKLDKLFEEGGVKGPPQVIKNKEEQLAETLRKDNLYHGGIAGLKTEAGEQFLKRPLAATDDSGVAQSTGGIYSVLNVDDPRFFNFAGRNINPNKAGYVVSPELRRTVDAADMPKDLQNKLYNRLSELQQVDDFGGLTPLERYTYFNIAKILGKEPIKGSGLVPGVFQKETGDIFRQEGFDSILFPKRPNFKGEGKTLISVADDNLRIADEIKYDEVADFIRKMTKK